MSQTTLKRPCVGKARGPQRCAHGASCVTMNQGQARDRQVSRHHPVGEPAPGEGARSQHLKQHPRRLRCPPSVGTAGSPISTPREAQRSPGPGAHSHYSLCLPSSRRSGKAAPGALRPPLPYFARVAARTPPQAAGFSCVGFSPALPSDSDRWLLPRFFHFPRFRGRLSQITVPVLLLLSGWGTGSGAIQTLPQRPQCNRAGTQLAWLGGLSPAQGTA